ncbi:hypothetical protein BDA96_04G255700 [Sorghum bicolor]|uniref:Uncharacterized protein n=1 Tax=Sorghum bicolor TaxID=4558 RepID=A0A921UJA3_SORBI|nr:hypothetical protein BDA96_04G255700 [Sorghum bicolor]
MRARQLGITKFEACFCMLIISICGDAAKVVGLSVQKMTITVPLASFENIEGDKHRVALHYRAF